MEHGLETDHLLPLKVGVIHSIISETSWPYFGVKLSCVCLNIAFKKG